MLYEWCICIFPRVLGPGHLPPLTYLTCSVSGALGSPTQPLRAGSDAGSLSEHPCLLFLPSALCIPGMCPPRKSPPVRHPPPLMQRLAPTRPSARARGREGGGQPSIYAPSLSSLTLFLWWGGLRGFCLGVCAQILENGGLLLRQAHFEVLNHVGLSSFCCEDIFSNSNRLSLML